MRKKLGFLCLALVLTMGTMGVGYALWWDDLFIRGTVNTGDIGLEWTNDFAPYDNEGAEKDVSWATSRIDGDTFIVEIFNAYPCITYTIPFDLHGTGSVPVHTAFSLNTGNMDPSWITMPDLSGWQIHFGDRLDGEIVVHLDNTALQNTTYTFSATLVYWQYNEAGPS